MDEADLLLDRPPGGWDDLVTEEWLHLELGALEARMDARFEAIIARFAEVDARFEAIDGRLGATDERLGSLEQGFRRLESRIDDLAKDLRSQTWRLVSVLVAAMAVAIGVNRL
jgi:chromosome segregation ATPase